MGAKAEVAIKFFLSQAAFERETQVYETQLLRDILLPLLDVSGPSANVQTLSGFRLPPYIVVERGEVCHRTVPF